MSRAGAPGKPRSGFERRVGGVLIGRINRLLRTVRTARADQFATLSPRSGAIVFLGDGITEGGLWSEWVRVPAVARSEAVWFRKAPVSARMEAQK